MSVMSAMALHGHYTDYTAMLKLFDLCKLWQTADILRIFSFGWHYIAHRKAR